MQRYFYEGKELEKLLKEIDSLLGKLIKFNIHYPCQLLFGFSKIDLKIFPIVSHNEIDDFNYKFYLNDNKLLVEEESDELLSKTDFNKFKEKLDPLSIKHNVVLSTHELDLSLERSDLYVYSEGITIFIVQKFKEFLNFRLIENITFIFDEEKNIFSIESIDLYDKTNPISIRQKKIYLTNHVNNIGFFNSDREDYLNKKIIELCKLHLDKNNPNYIKQILTREDNDKEVINIERNGLKFQISKEFIRALAKSIEIIYTVENIKGVNTITNLVHVEYSANNTHQYVFYRYYSI